MAEGYWGIVTITSGQIAEKVKSWYPGNPKQRSARQKKSDDKKLRQNACSTIRTYARLLNLNFPYDRGISMLLDYSLDGLKRLGQEYDPNDPAQWDAVWLAANHQLQLFLERCRRACKAAGIPFRYLAATSDLRWDGKLQEYVHTRIHHHIIVNPECLEICMGKWSLGGIGDRRLRREPDHTEFARYLMEQVRRIGESKKYIPSKTLRRPKFSAPRFAPSDREVQPPRGAVLLERSPYQYGRPQYIRYLVPDKPGGGLNGEEIVVG